MKYEVIIWWSEDDQSYLAEIPELPGCVADGKSHPELLRNLEEVGFSTLKSAQIPTQGLSPATQSIERGLR